MHVNSDKLKCENIFVFQTDVNLLLKFKLPCEIKCFCQVEVFYLRITALLKCVIGIYQH